MIAETQTYVTVRCKPHYRILLPVLTLLFAGLSVTCWVTGLRDRPEEDPWLGTREYAVGAVLFGVLAAVAAWGAIETTSMYKSDEQTLSKRRIGRWKTIRWDEIEEFRIRRFGGDHTFVIRSGKGVKLSVDFHLLGRESPLFPLLTSKLRIEDERQFRQPVDFGTGSEDEKTRRVRTVLGVSLFLAGFALSVVAVRGLLTIPPEFGGSKFGYYLLLSGVTVGVGSWFLWRASRD